MIYSLSRYGSLPGLSSFDCSGACAPGLLLFEACSRRPSSFTSTALFSLLKKSYLQVTFAPPAARRLLVYPVVALIYIALWVVAQQCLLLRGIIQLRRQLTVVSLGAGDILEVGRPSVSLATTVGVGSDFRVPLGDLDL